MLDYDSFIVNKMNIMNSLNFMNIMNIINIMNNHICILYSPGPVPAGQLIEWEFSPTHSKTV